MQFQESVSLAPFTTFRIGGPARWFAEATTDDDIAAAVAFARERSIPFFALGGGSNLLVSDNGYHGLVIHISLRGIEQQKNTFRVAAGEEWDRFVTFAVERGFGGIECLAGIPGTAGATPVQNVGAYGQEVAETITAVRAYDTRTNRFVDLAAADCGFAYRRSLFNSTERGRYIVTRVDYRLRTDAQPNLVYADLQRCFAGNAHPSLSEVSAAVREIRHRKGMLIVEGDPDSRSAGSFFKNPVIDQPHYERIAADFAARVPSYSAGNSHVKLPAAWLVEQAGFPRSYVAGNAGISSRHTLALISRDHASAADILALRDQIVVAVQQKFQITLEMEPVLLR